MRFVKNFTPPDFQAEDFTPLISLNFNSFSDKTQNKSVFGEIYTIGKKIYTAGGIDGSDKSHLCMWHFNGQQTNVKHGGFAPFLPFGFHLFHKGKDTPDKSYGLNLINATLSHVFNLAK